MMGCFLFITTVMALFVRYPLLLIVLFFLIYFLTKMSNQRDKINFEKLLVENFPYIISYIISHSDRKKTLVLNTKSTLLEYFDENIVKKIMSFTKKCDQNGVSETEFDNACFNIASRLNYSDRYKLYNIFEQIVGVASVSEQNILNTIAIKLNIAYNGSGGAYQTFYEFFKNYTSGSYSQYSSDNNNRQSYNRSFDYDPYKVLGVSKNATDDEIKKTYRHLCKKYHPDKTSGLSESEKAEAEKKIREIISAYDTIKQERSTL